ncbi:hypothetical protein L7F22_062948 [Adiantum nelumboides]|nr:hypothetical protein [Adiantum nelumboides]
MQSPKPPTSVIVGNGAMVHAQNGALVVTTPSGPAPGPPILFQDTRSGRVSPNRSGLPVPAHNLNNITNSSSKPLTEKAEAFAEAHRGRVEAEAHAFQEAESRKVEAPAQKNLLKRQKLHEEARAMEAKQREEQRAEQVIRMATVKAEKIITKAREEANRINSRAQEETEKAIADAYTKGERWKTKKKELVEITDHVQHMIAVSELPAIEHKGVVQRMKLSFVCHTEAFRSSFFLLHHLYIVRFGVFLVIFSDRGPSSRGDVVEELMKKLKIKRRHSTPYYPQCNGLVEKVNGMICKIITKQVVSKPKEWDKYLEAALWSYRTSLGPH